MDKIILTKPYIIEDIKLLKGTKIRIMEDNKYNNLLIDKNGKFVSEEEFNKLCSPIFNKLESEGLIPKDNAARIKKDTADWISTQFARYLKMPDYDNVVTYLQNRKQSFATN